MGVTDMRSTLDCERGDIVCLGVGTFPLKENLLFTFSGFNDDLMNRVCLVNQNEGLNVIDGSQWTGFSKQDDVLYSTNDEERRKYDVKESEITLCSETQVDRSVCNMKINATDKRDPAGKDRIYNQCLDSVQCTEDEEIIMECQCGLETQNGHEGSGGQGVDTPEWREESLNRLIEDGKFNQDQIEQLKHDRKCGYRRYSSLFRDSKDMGHLVLGDVCGLGISSIVRKCVEKDTGKEYAVKIIDISGEKDNYVAEQTKRETIREINILKMCNGHPHIIELHDSFETPTFIFLVFELCKQGELFDYLTQVVTLSEKRTRVIMKQLLEAVAFIHEKNIVHRDLKPENILLDDNLNVKLSDFGFATVVNSETELTELCGTPGYLAPEVLAVSMYEDAPGYGKAVDVWACGVIMYTLLCGAPPFWHRKQMQMLRMIMQANYKFGSPEWDDISQTVKDLISRMLVVDPSKRLTANEALQHPFFKRQLKPTKKFYARRVFKAGIICVTFFHRLRFLYHNPPPISKDVVLRNPYSVKGFRKLIDGCAFKMYGHWVKKGENQKPSGFIRTFTEGRFQK
ncbi:hypothetical protein FSP39_021016 [Pinctada imbricata]|uniref:phosphorylase kinase n=1 Tax=Pinctada imbricata TaxID=66713 RepID=A0AA89BQ53_PINIB|nr:hypothetical protein FSP39_021016 [Pinctada imbricata]